MTPGARVVVTPRQPGDDVAHGRGSLPNTSTHLPNS
jgi:hypothetical protein